MSKTINAWFALALGSGALVLGIASASAAEKATAPTPAPALTACPTSGSSAVIPANASCYVFTPATAGANDRGAGAKTNNYALAPTSGGSGNLVVYLNGSNGSPDCCLASATQNVFTAAAAAGHHVLALSYYSDNAIGQLCGTDACFLPTRLTVVTGVYQTGAAAELRTIMPSEGIYSRLALALAYLAQAKPEEGWGSFLQPGGNPRTNPADAVIWPKIITTGHSQGGGHATLLGKLKPVRRIVAFSSPCDADPSGKPATWLTYDASWATNPATSAFGFAARTDFGLDGHPNGGDEVCPIHMRSLDVMGVHATRKQDDAAVCKAGSVGAHGSSIRCAENYSRWVGLFQLN